MRNAFVTAVYFSTLAIVLPVLLLAVLVAAPVIVPLRCRALDDGLLSGGDDP